jgi:hypothetical protein
MSMLAFRCNSRIPTRITDCPLSNHISGGVAWPDKQVVTMAKYAVLGGYGARQAAGVR